MQVRQRNEEDRQRRDQFRAIREAEEDERLMRNQAERDARRNALA